MIYTHVYPYGDKRGHVTNGDPCPCLPTTIGQVVRHNAYDVREVGATCRRALDLLTGALVAYGHTWTDTERAAYEHAVDLLNMHWPEPGQGDE